MVQDSGHLHYIGGDLHRVLQVEMGRVKLQITVLVALALILPYASATTYTVGDTSQWDLGLDYSTWVSGKTFAVGDKLTFTYSSAHSVLEVTKSAYDSCNTASPLKIESGSPTTVTLDKTGGRWFICGTPSHCSGGMKLAINVLPATVTPATPTSTAPPGASITSPAASTTTPSPPQIDCFPPPAANYPYNDPYNYFNSADPLLFQNKFSLLCLIGLLLYVFI